MDTYLHEVMASPTEELRWRTSNREYKWVAILVKLEDEATQALGTQIDKAIAQLLAMSADGYQDRAIKQNQAWAAQDPANRKPMNPVALRSLADRQVQTLKSKLADLEKEMLARRKLPGSSYSLKAWFEYEAAALAYVKCAAGHGCRLHQVKTTLLTDDNSCCPDGTFAKPVE